MSFESEHDGLTEPEIEGDQAELKRIGETLRKRLERIFEGGLSEATEPSSPIDKDV